MPRRRIHLQFPLSSFFGSVAVVALFCAALVNASRLWASTCYTLTLLLLLSATLAAVFRLKNRTFWVGFIVFGWAYLFFAFGPWVGPPLLSAQGLAYLESKAGKEDGSVSFSPDGRLLVTGSGSSAIRLWDVATGIATRHIDRPFHQIGHSVVSLGLALVGGILACWLRAKPTTPADADVPPP